MKRYDPSDIVLVVNGFIKKLELKRGKILANLGTEDQDELDQYDLGMISRTIDLANQLIDRFQDESKMRGQDGLDTIDMFHELRKRMNRIDKISNK